MFPFDEENEGEVSFGESSDAEREMTPDIPKAPSVKTYDESGDFESAGDVDKDTLRAFVVAVIYANVALLLVFLGPMVWYFEGWSRAGPALLVIGLLAGIRTYQTYRAWDRSRTDDPDEAVDADPDETADPDPDETVDADPSGAVDPDPDETADPDPVESADAESSGDAPER